MPSDRPTDRSPDEGGLARRNARPREQGRAREDARIATGGGRETTDDARDAQHRGAHASRNICTSRAAKFPEVPGGGSPVYQVSDGRPRVARAHIRRRRRRTSRELPAYHLRGGMRATAARSAPLARPSTLASRGFGVTPRGFASSFAAHPPRRPFASRRGSRRGSRPRTSAIVAANDGDPYVVGCGTGDCTGPIDGVGMMGYASVTQTTNSLWQRQWARAFVLSSAPPGTGARLRPDTTVAVVVVDACMVFPDLKAAALREVSAILAARAVADASRESSPYDAENLAGSFDALVQDDLVSVDASPFDETNVCVCATHTHAAPGGYAPHPLYNLTLGGRPRRVSRATRRCRRRAHRRARDAAARDETTRITLAKRRVPGVAVNRSPAAYARNPSEERDAHEGNVDDTLTVLAAFGNPEDEDEDVDVLCAMAWFAVHGTSLRRTNRSVSGDNKGVASWLAETALRGEGRAGASALETSVGAKDGEAVFEAGFAAFPRPPRRRARRRRWPRADSRARVAPGEDTVRSSRFPRARRATSRRTCAARGGSIRKRNRRATTISKARVDRATVGAARRRRASGRVSRARMTSPGAWRRVPPRRRRR